MDKISPFLIPFASSMVGLIPVLINLTVNYFDKKSHKAQRDAELNYLNQRVNFLSNWVKLHKEVSNPEMMKRVNEMIEDELRDAYEEFASAMLEVEKESMRRQELMRRVRSMNFVKRLFLLYTPYNVRGWLYHTLFYMCVLPLVAGFGYVVYHYVQTSIWLEGVPQEYLYAGIGLGILAILFHWLGRSSARDMEQRMTTLERKTTPLGRSSAS